MAVKCSFPGCSKHFRTPQGLGVHIRRKHSAEPWSKSERVEQPNNGDMAHFAKDVLDVVRSLRSLAEGFGGFANLRNLIDELDK